MTDYQLVELTPVPGTTSVHVVVIDASGKQHGHFLHEVPSLHANLVATPRLIPNPARAPLDAEALAAVTSVLTPLHRPTPIAHTILGAEPQRAEKVDALAFASMLDDERQAHEQRARDNAAQQADQQTATDLPGTEFDRGATSESIDLSIPAVSSVSSVSSHPTTT